ncbi:hypothetical protein A3H09_01040 [Candidatus Falkowbacteria bacterium RIFCSPLOWO2_12_FULL_45_13]|uniref:DNA 3'-5' helicase n=1 Tax=Candidatus Falkowbacteria bacterium RIFCSPLOWO2_12_FULL_45_13 TaxID=1797991 RepID=A0A1F5SWY9_9BACT|nr:MAG: hypothetical protein A3H09_01040 [Candidatus Falkowbacteria bacterium RIFCSPLOWO2_12_FULL_45_13]
MSLLDNLNPEQLAAVKHQDGPLLIVAGAGTGKTTVITRRLAYLIERRLAAPEEILALTFTEKAAGEMSGRVEALLPYGYFDLWISTFHGFAERLLKEHGLSIGLPVDFKLLNEFEQWALVKKNLEKFELDYYRPLGNPTKFIHALLKHFSRAKDEDLSPEQYLEYADGLKQNLDGMLGGSSGLSLRGASEAKRNERRGNLRLDTTNQRLLRPAEAGLAMTDQQETARINEVANAYHVYQQLLLDNNALDFGDLINYALKLFRSRPAILEKYRGQFKYLLLDEFQDTNWAQYELIKILAAPWNNLVVVGDDDQSIFRFRGASMSNILQFTQDYPRTKKIFLTANYRSCQNILDLSYDFIKQNNPNRLEWQLESQKSKVSAQGGSASGGKSQKLNKKLIAENKGRGVIEVIQGQDLAEEVKLAADKIIELKNKAGADGAHPSWNDFAILIRANDSARDFMAEFARRSLPYIFGAARGLYLKPVIMDAIAYFKLLDNYHESAAVWRMLNLPIYNFSDTELVNFNHLAEKKALSLFEVLNRAAVLKFSAELQEKIKPFLAMVARHTALAREKTASEIFLAFMNDSGYLKYLAEQSDASHLEEPHTQGDERSIISGKRLERRIIDSSLPAAAQNDKGAESAEQKSLENISLLNQFLKRIRSFESSTDDKSVKSFLAELNLELEAGEAGSLAADLEAGPEAIKILTVHGAKGLEFRYVFIANLVDKRFPAVARSEPINLPDALVREILPAGDAQLEEERRLFYVAMTRAKQSLYFSWARDYGGLREKKPSRFLVELRLVEKVKANICHFRAGGPPAGRAGNPEISSLGKTVAVLDPRAKLEDDKLNNIPSHFSYSHLAAYSHCPYQYRFAHVLKIPVRGKEQFSFGKTLHATLQKLFLLLNEKKGLGQGDLFGSVTSPNPLLSKEGDRTVLPSPSLKTGAGEISARGAVPAGRQGSPPKADQPLAGATNLGGKEGVNITLEEILKLYEQSWIDDWYESKQKKQERKEQGREILKVFYEKHRGRWPEVLCLEKSFNLKIACPEPGPGADGEKFYIMRGTIDRIDKIGPAAGSASSPRPDFVVSAPSNELGIKAEQADGLKLVDYKTGRAKETLSFEDKEQLFIYQLAAAELFKQPVSGLAFYYLENNSEIEFIGQARDLEKIKAKIIAAIEAIGRGEFPPKPGQICAWCDFRGICEYRQ